MATFTRFEEIESWQKARHLAAEIYRVTAEGAFARDFGLRDQIRRSAVSVMANIAEGFGRGGNKEFVLFLSIARGSAVEVKSHLYVALDAGMLSETSFHPIYKLASEAEALISGLMKYLATSDARGRKFNLFEKAQTAN
jgi:four helix bundle protein